MRNILKIVLATVFTILIVSSCYYDKEEILYGASKPCTDSVGTVSYSQKLVPIFQQNCYTCHGSSFPSGGIAMGTYTTNKALATSGKLFGSISHTSGFSPMPKSAAKLSACSIAAIKKWIDAGAPNN